MEKVAGEWKLELVIYNDTTIDDHSADFHDVKVLTYSLNRELLNTESVGDIPYTRGLNNGQPVTTMSQVFPYLLVLQARETPCDDRTEVQFYYMKDGLWEPAYRRCDEGLPPKRRDGEPTAIETPDEKSE